MLSPRWKKILRDFQASTGRMVMTVIAIAVSIFAVGAILSAYTILTREISRNYLGTNPASAYLQEALAALAFTSGSADNRCRM